MREKRDLPFVTSHIAFVAPYLIAVILMVTVAAVAWPRRDVRGRGLFIVFCLAAGYWSLFEGMLYLGLGVEANLLITYFQYFGIVATAPAGLMLSCAIFGYESWLKPSRVVLLFVVPCLTVAAVWTNPWHHLYYEDWYRIDTGPFPMLGLVHGPLFKITVGYHYLILIVTLAILLHQFTVSRGFRRGQAGIILFPTALVWAANIVYICGLSPIPNMDISPIMFSFVAIAFAWGFFRYSLLDIVPIAKAEVFDGIADAILVADHKDRLVSINPAGENLIGKPLAKVLGEPMKTLVAEWPDLSIDGETVMELTVKGRIHEARFSVLRDRKARTIGWLAVFHDISKRKRLETELIRLATTDSLTGIPNRRHLLHLAESAFSRAERYGQDLSVIMIDADHFKTVNDRWGHDTGDEVLKTMVRICRMELREVDEFGRLGGEEFAAVLTETDMTGAVQVAERLREAVERLTPTTALGPVSMTISLGVAALTADDTTFKELLKRADQALYRAKADGRNRVATARILSDQTPRHSVSS